MVDTVCKAHGQSKDYVWHNYDIDDFAVLQGFGKYEAYISDKLTEKKD